MRILRLLTFIVILATVCSCNSDKDRHYYLDDSVGRYNVVTVVSSKEFYNESLFETLSDTAVFGRLFPGLLFPPESRLVSRNISPKSFKNLRTSRNVLAFKKGKAGIDFVTDSTAKPQAFAVVKGNSKAEQLAAIRYYADSLVNFFVNSDDRAIRKLNTKYDIKEKPFLDSLGLEMLLPESYSPVKRQNDFIWYRKDLNEDILNMMYYTFPFKSDSLTLKDMMALRNIMAKRHIKGKKAGDYARTDTVFIPMVETIATTPKEDVFLMRGIWSLKIGMLGGPFVTKFILDKKSDQLYVADSYLVAKHVRYQDPNKSKKRQYLMQVESLLGTFKRKNK